MAVFDEPLLGQSALDRFCPRAHQFVIEGESYRKRTAPGSAPAPQTGRRALDLHVIVDNLNTHKPKHDRWRARHPNVHFHYTPTHASWLNQIECWFSILSRQALQGASFTSVAQLRQAIDNFVATYNQTATPFEWTKQAVKKLYHYLYSDLHN